MKYLFIIALFFSGKPAAEYFCTCLPLPKSELIDTADLIFTGRAYKIDTVYILDSSYKYSDTGKTLELLLQSYIKVSFKVDKILKGNPATKEWYVYTRWQCCVCGANFFFDTDYIVMARKHNYIELEDDPRDPYGNIREFEKKTGVGYFTSFCSGTDEVYGDFPEYVSKYLKNKKKYKRVINNVRRFF